MSQLSNDLYQQYTEEATLQTQNFLNELTDLAARYNVSVLGDMERRGVINDGPGVHLATALGRLSLLNQSF